MTPKQDLLFTLGRIVDIFKLLQDFMALTFYFALGSPHIIRLHEIWPPT